MPYLPCKRKLPSVGFGGTQATPFPRGHRNERQKHAVNRTLRVPPALKRDGTTTAGPKVRGWPCKRYTRLNVRRG
jgi:hypothetical protein